MLKYHFCYIFTERRLEIVLETWSELIKCRKFPRDSICILSNVKMAQYLEQTSWLVIEWLWVERKMACLVWLLAMLEKSVQPKSPVCWAGNRTKGKTATWRHCDRGFRGGTSRPQGSSDVVWLGPGEVHPWKSCLHWKCLTLIRLYACIFNSVDWLKTCLQTLFTYFSNMKRYGYCDRYC